MGEFLSLATAIVWALAIILFKRSGETLSPFALNLFRVVISSVAFLATLPFFTANTIFPSKINDILLLSLSGIIGIVISDTLFHKALNLCGAGIMGIVDCFYSPFVAILAFWLLKETLTSLQLIGMILVICAVFLVGGGEKSLANRSQLIQGIITGILAMFSVAVAIVIIKPVLVHTSLLWAFAIRQLAALVIMFPIALFSSRRQEYFNSLFPTQNWYYALPGALLGSYFAALLWIAGMKYTQTGVAAILNQTNSIFILILATIFLKEKFTLLKSVATTLAVLGIILITL
jgi:drug/metabolite transporter (DMT)-like permease